jgi:hypothetical protein
MYENRIIKPVKIVPRREDKIRKSNRGGGFDQCTLYAYIEIPQ